MTNQHKEIEQLYRAVQNEVKQQKEMQKNCKHHPFDRDIDKNENQYCTLCGKITKTAEDLYGQEDIF